jgi:hypothetical protein
MKKKTTEPLGWTTNKNGALNNGNWYASRYPTGWYFVTQTAGSASANKENYGGSIQKHICLGPFITFDEGLKVWSANQ